MKRAFFADHWIPLVFLESTVCDRLGQGRLESAVSCSEESFVCFLQCSSGTVLHLHSRICFWQDYCHCSNRKLACFGIILSNPCEAALCFLFVCSYLRRRRKMFDLTTAITAQVRASALRGEPTVSLQPLYVQCAIRSCLIFDSLRHYSRSTDIHCLFNRQGLLPAVGRCAGVRRTAR